MKKILSLFIVLCSTIIASAQVKCTSSNPDYTIAYKRTIVADNTVFVDFTVTYYGNEQVYFRIYDPKIYDDEGNIYSFSSYNVVNVGNTGKNGADIEPDIPIKVRIPIKNVDEFATLFNKMILPYGNGYDKNTFTITNVPIPRD
jgi:hypothetical protein